MSGMAERIRQLLAREGLKQKDLAEQLSTSAQTVNNWIKRDSISREAAQQISERYGYSLDWLLNGKGAPKVTDDAGIPPESEWGAVDAWDKNTPLPADEVEVPFLKDIEFACGDGRAMDEDHNGFKLRFSKATLRRVGANTDGTGVLCFPAVGNSMEPFIPDGATVAINCNDKRIVDGKVYAVNQDGWKRLKMLYRVGPDRVSLRSYNSQEHPDEEHPLSDIEIVGRMFWSSMLW
ncbi:repressor [Klebsiella aerogenes]|uniref:S24 family peptidase n=1 Tax=Klebsiella aerogenes TaxID=548 RepID=UPI0007355EEB|nr:S24 family peptidase [Klebsiella aerogenes]KTJ39829.1 repressor [Klebsiella aerogenes]